MPPLLNDLPFLRLDPKRIDDSDPAFRVRRLYGGELAASIRKSGIRAPLIVEPLVPGGRANGGSGPERFRIVSGRGRWLARPADRPVPCFVLPAGLAREEVWDVFLRDNDSWNVVEVGRVLAALESLSGLDEDRIVTGKLPLLGVHASRDLYRSYRRLAELDPAVQRFVEEEKLPLRRALLFCRLDPGAAAGILEAARELRLTVSEIGEAIERVEEVAGRDGVSALAVLERARRAAGEQGGKEAFRRALGELRNPEQTRYNAVLEECRRRLGFSLPVRVQWDPRLERPGIRLVADLAEREDVRKLVEELEAEHAALEDFFRIA